MSHRGGHWRRAGEQAVAGGEFVVSEVGVLVERHGPGLLPGGKSGVVLDDDELVGVEDDLARELLFDGGIGLAKLRSPPRKVELLPAANSLRRT